MPRFAVVDNNNKVVNVVLAADQPSVPVLANQVVYPLNSNDPVGPGWTRSGATWVAPVPDAAAATRDSNLAALCTKLTTALTANATYIALAAPSAAQQTAQVKALTQQVDALIRIAVNQLDVTTGT